MPASIKDLYPDKWITPAELPADGQVLTINRAAIEHLYSTIDREQQPRLILSFHEIDTRAALNKTQCFDIAAIIKNEDYTKWTGHQIKLTAGQARNKKPTIVFGQAQPPQCVVNLLAKTRSANGKPMTKKATGELIANLDVSYPDQGAAILGYLAGKEIGKDTPPSGEFAKVQSWLDEEDEGALRVLDWIATHLA